MIKVQSSNNVQLPNDQKTTKFDLEERTLKFSKEVLVLLKILPKTIISMPLITQLVRSATSIGANCCEATEAGSKKDFINKITIAKKEAKETRYWLKLMLDLFPAESLKIQKLLQEAQELNLILSAIVRNSKN
ncbi:MAG: four helix bundle protein [Candidatus Doudnabacteria bacterium]|nr:four helix bundle protein [Candidatus Doudnabacteria bacterium]